MKLTVMLFAGLSEVFGSTQLTVDIETAPITVGQFKHILIERYPSAAAAIGQAFIAKNQTYAADEETLEETDEIALIPPVSGGEQTANITSHRGVGSECSPFEITYEPLSVERVSAKVIHPHHGASLAFVGTTREYTAGKRTILLEYEAYIPMALRTMGQIGDEIASCWPGALTAISHRLGKVEISEISVVIAVSSPHRNDCYQASRYAIERLKQIVPVWKKEIWEDGSQWQGHQQGPWNPAATLNFNMDGEHNDE